jgi:protein gp37
MFREYPWLAARGVHGYVGGKPDQVRLWPERLDEPLHWQAPRRVFVCSMADLFHNDVPDDFMFSVFTRALSCPQHTFLFLTKRVGRMVRLAQRLSATSCTFQRNNMLGFSAEDQKTFDRRWDEALPLAIGGWKVFGSLEPLLGPIVLPESYLKLAKWTVVGGESGPEARPSHPDWFRSIRDQCQAAGVPFFFKQWGEWAPPPFLYKVHRDFRNVIAQQTFTPKTREIIWNGLPMVRMGRSNLNKLGVSSLLDGREWKEFPQL